MSTTIPTADNVLHFAVYGTLRDDCDALSCQEWTTKFVKDMSSTPRTARVRNMKMVYTQSLTENWPYALPSDDINDVVVVRLVEFRHNWAEKLIEADGVEQYDPNAPDSSPLGYKRRVVEAFVVDQDGKETGEIVFAVMYFISQLAAETIYHHIESGDWVKRDIAYHNVTEAVGNE
jgi:gamma-glutamylcyclotransferase (GGCT)/AIG2-like uncharacterized protein YtfP